MANSSKGAGNFLGPLFIVAVVVVGILVFTFSMSSEEVPDQATVIAEDDVDARPAGSGTVPEGEADETIEGVSDQLDRVDPAAPDEETVPPADMATENGADEGVEGETSADETTAGTADEPVITDVPAVEAETDGDQSGGSQASEGDAAATGDESTSGANRGAEGSDEGASDEDASNSDESFLIDEGSGDGQQNSDVVDADDGDLPAGRDTQTDLSPEAGQDVVEDTDDGGAAFVATPSGPEGRDDETIAE